MKPTGVSKCFLKCTPKKDGFTDAQRDERRMETDDVNVVHVNGGMRRGHVGVRRKVVLTLLCVGLFTIKRWKREHRPAGGPARLLWTPIVP